MKTMSLDETKWKLVPEEPTEEIVEAVAGASTAAEWPEAFGETARKLRREHAREAYRAMLASAPIPPAAPSQAEVQPVAKVAIGQEPDGRGNAQFNLLKYDLPVGEYRLFVAPHTPQAEIAQLEQRWKQAEEECSIAQDEQLRLRTQTQELQRQLEEALTFAWKGFDDIEDDARVLLEHAPESLHAMILGIREVAIEHRQTISVATAIPPKESNP